MQLGLSMQHSICVTVTYRPLFWHNNCIECASKLNGLCFDICCLQKSVQRVCSCLDLVILHCIPFFRLAVKTPLSTRCLCIYTDTLFRSNVVYVLPAGKGAAGAEDSWDPSSDTPSLDKGARVTDPRTPPEQRSKLSPTDVSVGL